MVVEQSANFPLVEGRVEQRSRSGVDAHVGSSQVEVVLKRSLARRIQNWSRQSTEKSAVGLEESQGGWGKETFSRPSSK